MNTKNLKKKELLLLFFYSCLNQSIAKIHFHQLINVLEPLLIAYICHAFKIHLCLIGLKKNKSKLDPIDFSNIKVDIHSHLIPGIDDGAKSIEDSLALIKELVKYGYKKIITTPHVMSDLYKNDSTTIISGLEKIRRTSKRRKY